jgi:hypothetical protein
LASSMIRLQVSRFFALSLHSLQPSFSGSCTRLPAIWFLASLFVLLHTAFRTSFLELRSPKPHSLRINRQGSRKSTVLLDLVSRLGYYGSHLLPPHTVREFCLSNQAQAGTGLAFLPRVYDDTLNVSSWMVYAKQQKSTHPSQKLLMRTATITNAIQSLMVSLCLPVS